MTLKQKKVRWISENGSIFTEATAKVKFEFTGFKEIRECVACNVGTEVADHIVRLHNDQLQRESIIDRLIHGENHGKI
jgi:hypothetical protein